MARRLRIGIKAMRRLPTFTTDAPPSLAKVRRNPSTTTAATMRRLSHAEHRYVESMPGRLFHMDICRPLPESKLGRFKYATVLVDDSTRFNMGIAMRSRDEAGAHIRRFIARFNSLAAHSQGRVSKVGTLLTDGAREFLSNAVQHLLDENGVNKVEAPPEVHALNGVAERAILSIFTRVRTHLKQSHAPKGFWPEAMSHSIDILKRVTGAPHGRCSSYESRAMVRPRIMSIQPWGCRAWALTPARTRLKLDPSAIEGINLGRSERQPGAYLIWVPHQLRTVSTSDATFDETNFPWRPPGWYVVLDAYGCTESSLGPGLSVPHTLTRVPRAPEHQAPPSVPGGAIGWVLDCGDCGDFGWYDL